ncbi:MAG: RagB/SusD family nutrient uptake outer membrane protein [Balneolaceae bacterium]
MRSLKYITAFVSLLLVWGCQNILDTQPQQSISDKTALSTSDNVITVLHGAYDHLGDYDEYGGQLYMLPDLMAVGQEAQWTGTYEQPGEIYRKNIAVDNSFVRDAWLNGYSTINVANNVLSALDVVDASEQDRVEGEAKFIRAITYFQLVRLFAKDYNDGDPTQNLGVPLKLDPTDVIDDSDNIPRNTVQEVYDQVIQDLNDAKTKLTAHSPSYPYADTYAASAFLARVYMQQGQYAMARDEANRVIEQGPYSLVPNFADAFNNSDLNTSEDIFAMQVTNQDGTNSLQIFYASQDNGGRGDIEIQQAHLNLYNSTDDRLAFFYDDGGNWRTGKWANQYGNVNVIRLAEMYLDRAECNQRLGETVGATPTEDYNAVHGRSDPSNTLAPGTATLADILAERHIELAFEGHFLFDLKRTQGNIGGLQWDSPRLVYPIPQREIDANSNLVQNEGYGGS